MPYLSIINKNQSTESGWKVCFQVVWIACINIDIPFLGTIEFKYKFYHKSLSLNLSINREFVVNPVGCTTAFFKK